MTDKIVVTKKDNGYDAAWDNVHGIGKTHMEALKGLHYMLNFFDGTIENPTPLPVTNFEFEDECADLKCPCNICKTCGGTGIVATMGRVYAGEPHMADVDDGPCPDCRG